MRKYFLVILILIISGFLILPLEAFARGGGHGGGARGGSRGGGRHVSPPAHRPGGTVVRSVHPGHRPYHPYHGPYHAHYRHHWHHYPRWWVSAPYCPWWDYYCGPFWSWQFYGFYGSLEAPVFAFEENTPEEEIAYFPVAPLPDMEMEPESWAGAPLAPPGNPPPEPGPPPP